MVPSVWAPLFGSGTSSSSRSTNAAETGEGRLTGWKAKVCTCIRVPTSHVAGRSARQTVTPLRLCAAHRADRPSAGPASLGRKNIKSPSQTTRVAPDLLPSPSADEVPGSPPHAASISTGQGPTPAEALPTVDPCSPAVSRTDPSTTPSPHSATVTPQCRNRSPSARPASAAPSGSSKAMLGDGRGQSNDPSHSTQPRGRARAVQHTPHRPTAAHTLRLSRCRNETSQESRARQRTSPDWRSRSEMRGAGRHSTRLAISDSVPDSTFAR